MTLPAESNPRRPRRAGHQKSRTGCSTCRIRRIKCDETRPSCRRCTESGRQCEGPLGQRFQFINREHITRARFSGDNEPTVRATPPGLPRESSLRAPPREVSLLAPQHSADERRAFHYFQHRAAPLFAGAVDAGFWKHLVPQLAQTYSFVWDTLVSLSVLLEHVPYAPLRTAPGAATPSQVISREHRLALGCYARAINQVRQLADLGQADHSVVVLSCILFASVEFQHGDSDTGTEMVKRCCSMMIDNLVSPNARPNSTAGQVIHQVVSPFVLKKGVLIATLGNAPPYLDFAPGRDDSTCRAGLHGPSTLCQASSHFFRLMHQTYELVRLADLVPHFRTGSGDRPLFASRRQSSLEELVRWKESFTTERSRTTETETDWITAYLLTYWAVCYISLAACVSHRQTVFDEYVDDFAEMVACAAAYLERRGPSTNTHLPSDFVPAITPALYFCATKCRHPVVRRDALRLMRQALLQEHPWPLVVPDRVAARVIDVEEGHHHFSSATTSSPPECGPLPPEENRFAYVSVVCRRAAGSQQRLALELSRFEGAADGSECLVNDYTWLDNEGPIETNLRHDCRT